MKTYGNSLRACAVTTLFAVVLTGCSDMLTVSDPQRYTADDLDKALDAVANGIEGDLYAGFDNLVNATSLNSDEAQHTGTWIGYNDLDKGRFRYSNASGGGGLGSSDNVMVNLLRVRFFALSGQERFSRVLGNEAESSPLMARARTVEGWTNLLLAQNFCEAPAEPGGTSVPDTELLELAIGTLTGAIQTAQAAGRTDVARWAQAGRARAHLLKGDYASALADAQQIPTDFVWTAHFSSNSGRQYNDIVNLSTAGYNRSSGIREFYWTRVDRDSRAMRDPYTGELDARLPVYFDGGKGVDGVTDHYSQWKYQTLDADIQLTDGREMRLIEAEVAWHNDDLETAMARINAVREAAGLTARPPTADADQVFEYLLYERFAELFWEGQRMSDLHRFGLVAAFIAEGRFGAETESPRPTKFPLAYTEALNNPSITDKGSAGRCLPMSG